MKMLLKIAHFVGGGLSPFLEMDCDGLIDWLYTLQDVQREENL